MASIFTYDPDLPRVTSPWLQGTANTDSLAGIDSQADRSSLHPRAGSDLTVNRLQAEPQQGPVEYKLHLLLRSRRKFRYTSTGSHISGSRHSNFGVDLSGRSVSESAAGAAPEAGIATPPSASTQQTRQHRLEQLTTQLLWRLQQSSPHHTSSATNMILPSLPEALPELQAPHQLAKLLHGLEETQGALYEIGVSDDGTLVGLAEDELEESLNNLRAMAACLGCTVEILRKETVGECEWLEEAVVSMKNRSIRRFEKLIVAEAFVKPQLHMKRPHAKDSSQNGRSTSPELKALATSPPATEQLRVTLTGPTMSGKSSLLGSLTTSTLDNGRGKSRLSMLKHRHEITSGITSSVTQELVGYQDTYNSNVEVVNYAKDNVASWIDVHVAASGSRLVFISDSAGHPRYRRTTVRGLVGWAPHWTLLCVPADDTEDTAGRTGSRSAAQQSLGSAVSDIDLSGAQLDLCLRLNLPLVIVITKLDLASRTGLRETLSKVLDTLKAAGRKPAIMPNSPGAVSEADLQSIKASQIDGAYTLSLPLLNDLTETVPIVLTSAVQGTGLNNLHALLHELPIPAYAGDTAKNADAVFHIEDVYTKAADIVGLIVSGRLRAGQISVGDSVVLGPFSGYGQYEDSEDSDERPARRPSFHLPISRSFPGALRDSHLAPRYFHLPKQEWRRVKVISIRNLRLPVHSLMQDQVGTIAIAVDEADEGSSSIATLARIRKGMVLATVQPLATRTFVAEFEREDLEALAVGNHVVVYIASVRASAKVVSARAPDWPEERRHALNGKSVSHDPFDFEDVAEALEGPPKSVAGAVTASSLLVTFSFDAAKEFIMIGEQVLIMPGGGPGLYNGLGRGEKGVAGLEGFVGVVTETHR
ncbi:hypothetical protein LTR36_007519 [Oleoguttula mirabilis]|uniref:Tr-type G domain-containing protein n=1 Tax=Oleoguttula mirabilis TaxID=1507867 RepID=A0AAV9JTQ2_9PEZI|nr:hypothetical protein LTR36_007519 [Oleoguttula mirabilis]